MKKSEREEEEMGGWNGIWVLTYSADLTFLSSGEICLKLDS